MLVPGLSALPALSALSARAARVPACAAYVPARSARAAGALRGLDRHRRDQRLHDVGPFLRGEREGFRRRNQFAQQGGELFAGIPGIERRQRTVGTATQGFQRHDAGAHQGGKFDFLLRTQGGERREGGGKPA